MRNKRAYILLALLALLLLSGCAAQTQKREPVLALQCTHPTSLSTIRPAGDGAVDGLPVAESLQDVRRYADVLEETYGVRILLSPQCRVAERPLGAAVMIR